MSDVFTVTVTMPERGTFLVRAATHFADVPYPAGTRGVVKFDYGTDVGVLSPVVRYDSALHGARLPGFRLERLVTADDEAHIAENDRRAEEMKRVFVEALREVAEDVRIAAVRLSFGRDRFFVRYTAPRPRLDLSRAAEALKQRWGVSVHMWQLGLRDEVACVGALGPCGRVCCCASWQRRPPSPIVAPAGLNPVLANGACGRYKCCWAFEAEGAEQDAVQERSGK